MKGILSSAVMFTVGAAIGAVVAWKVTSTKYEQILQEEIDSVKEVFSKRQAELTQGDTETTTEEEVASEDDEPDPEMLEMYKKILEEQNYGEVDDTERPYLIESAEYGEFYDYETVELSYYACGTLVDDDSNEVIVHANTIVGRECLDEFEDEDVDVIHVRNDKLKCDYEISRDPRTYEELMGSFPYLNNE